MERTITSILEEKGAAVHSIEPEATVLEAVQAMNRVGVGALLVKNGDVVVGIFTERDVLRRVVDGGLDPNLTKVAKVMTRELVTVRPTTTVTEAMAVMTDRRCRHLPVMEDDRLLGVVSIGDLTRATAWSQAVHIRDLVNYITGKYPA